MPKDDDGCRVNEPCASGTLGVLDGDFSSRDPVKWWYMKDGAVLGGHNGMIIEYDPSTLAPLGMVVSRDELEPPRGGDRRRVGWRLPVPVRRRNRRRDRGAAQRGRFLLAQGCPQQDVPHEGDRPVKAAKNYFQKMKGEEVELNVLSSYGPYTGTAGQVMGISTRAINPKAVAKK